MNQNITYEKYKEIFRGYHVPKEIKELFLFQYGKSNDQFI